MNKHLWTPEATEQAAAMWEAGESATTISKALKISRDAALGKMRRMKVKRPAITKDKARRIETVRSMTEAGSSLVMIAQRLGCTPETVSRIRTENRIVPARGETQLWSDADAVMVERLWREGRSASEIADDMGRSRSAVISKVHRLGLNGVRKRPEKPKVVARAPKPTPFVGHKTNPTEAAKARKALRVVGQEAVARVEAPVDVTDAKPLMARRFSECAWPVGTPDRPALQLCCGKPAEEGRSYCAEHHRRSTTGHVVSVREMIRSVRRAA